MKFLFAPFLAVIISTSSLRAQSPAIVGGLGLNFIDGDINTSAFNFSAWGPDFSIIYVHPFENARWNVCAEISTSLSSQNYAQIVGDSNIGIPQMRISQHYFGLSMRYVLLREVNNYNPYEGMILPYLEFGGGYSLNKAEFLGTELSPGYVLQAGNENGMAAQIGGGILVFVTKKWGIEGNFKVRFGFSDIWDGATGTGDDNDVLVRGNLAFHYLLF